VRNFTFFGSAVLYLIAIFLAYWNRDSEKVLTTFMVGLTALIGSLLAVVVFGAEPPIRKAFSTAIMIRSQDYLPYEDLPYSALPMGIVIDAREKLKAHPELIAEARKEGFANMLYQNLLQRSVVYWLETKYPTSWQSDTFPVTLGGASGYVFQSKPVSSRIFGSGELAQRMQGNKFGDVVGPLGRAPGFGLAVPKETELEITVPHFDPNKGEVSEIRLRNRLCTLTVDIRGAESGVGAGSYFALMGMNQEQAQKLVMTDQYSMVVTVSFNRFLAGHPEMPKYKQWASDIANGLEEQFDERLMWSKSKEWLFFKHAIATLPHTHSN